VIALEEGKRNFAMISHSPNNMSISGIVNIGDNSFQVEEDMLNKSFV
jgi:hypothetical protein